MPANAAAGAVLQLQKGADDTLDMWCTSRHVVDAQDGHKVEASMKLGLCQRCCSKYSLILRHENE